MARQRWNNHCFVWICFLAGLLLITGSITCETAHADQFLHESEPDAGVPASPATIDPWPMLGHDMGRTGYTDEVLTFPIEVKWRPQGPPSRNGPMLNVVSDGSTLVTLVWDVNMYPALHTYRVADGGYVWSYLYPTDQDIAWGHVGAVAQNQVIFVTKERGGSLHTVRSVDLDDGSELWSTALDGVLGQPAVTPRFVLVHDATGHRLLALDVLSGNLVWETPLAGLSNEAISPAVGADVYVHDQETLYAIGLSGSIDWTLSAPPMGFRGNPMVAGGKVFVATASPSGYSAFDDSTGALLWTAPGACGGAAYHANRVYLAGACGIYALDAGTGAEIWHTTPSYSNLSRPLLTGNGLLIATGKIGGSQNYGVLVLEASSGDTEFEWGNYLADVPYPPEPILVDGKLLLKDCLGYMCPWTPGGSQVVAIGLDATPPDAGFSWPPEGAYVTGTLDIAGTIQDPNLASWTLDYGRGLAPTSWSRIRSGTGPVDAGWIAALDTTDLDEDWWTLCLTVEDGAGNVTRTYVHFTTIYTPPPPKLSFTGFEVTQGIQNLNHDVSLIAGRRTYVRVYVESGTRLNKMQAELIGRRQGVELSGSPLQPLNDGGVLNVYPASNPRILLNQGYYFELPAEWASGCIMLQVQAVNFEWDQEYPPQRQVCFLLGPVPNVVLHGIVWTDQGVKRRPTVDEIFDAAEELEATYPVPYVDWSYVEYDPSIPIWKPGWAWLGADWRQINRTLANFHELPSPGQSYRFFLGIVAGPPATVSGQALGPKTCCASGYINAYRTLPHELAHCFGLLHTNCGCGEPGTGWFPYSGGKISPTSTGPQAFYGLDLYDESLYLPDSCDLMGYRLGRWTSDYTWNRIGDYLEEVYPIVPPTVAVGAAAADQAVWVVSGLITPTQGTGRIEAAYALTVAGQIDLPEPGEYTLSFEDAQGHELAAYPFELAATPGATDGDLVLRLPRNAATRRLVLRHGSQVLDERTASAHPPAVNLVYPNGGELLSGDAVMIEWNGTDADGDGLQYVLEYSADAGQSWQVVDVHMAGTTYALNAEQFKGSDEGLYRVSASDGFYTAQDCSDGTFHVARHAPQVRIRAPEASSYFVGGQSLFLEGMAYDWEDGRLSGDALTWSSSRDGTLGGGCVLVAKASDLAEGEHTLTLTAQDSDGQAASAEIQVTIYRTLETLPASLSVGPRTLSFVIYQGGGQTEPQPLAIDNSGDGRLSWSAAVDQPWIHIAPLWGTAPSVSQVTAYGPGLSPGRYVGQITLTAPGARHSPTRVDVELIVRERQKLYLPTVWHAGP